MDPSKPDVLVRPVVRTDRAAWSGLFAAYAQFYKVRAEKVD